MSRNFERDEPFARNTHNHFVKTIGLGVARSAQPKKDQRRLTLGLVRAVSFEEFVVRTIVETWAGRR